MFLDLSALTFELLDGIESKYEPFTPRLFRLSRASGKFAAEEVLCPSRPPDGICTFPFMQSDLYNSSQPGANRLCHMQCCCSCDLVHLAIFLLDAQCCVYLWCGWWPADQTDGNSKSITGLAASQWSQDKELAMKTAVNYAKCEHGRYHVIVCELFSVFVLQLLVKTVQHILW